MTDDKTPEDDGRDPAASAEPASQSAGPEPAQDPVAAAEAIFAAAEAQEGVGAPPADADADADEAGANDALAEAEAKAAEHLDDLRRLQAEYVNYRKRVDRDREQAGAVGQARVVDALLPVLDDIHAAREHGDLDGGPFAAIADKLEAALAKFGWESFGAAGDAFDPAVHEALATTEDPDVSEATVTQVAQPGHKVGDRVVRPARVIVAQPQS